MDKLLLVFYIGYNVGMDQELFTEYINQIKENCLTLTEAEDMTFFILPDSTIPIGTIKLDCINPKFVNKSVYDLIKEKVESIEENFTNILKTNKWNKYYY